MHAQPATFWCGVGFGSIVDPFSIGNEEEHNVDEMWFQQHYPTCHTFNVTVDPFGIVFENRIIRRNGVVNLAARSCDLTSLD